MYTWFILVHVGFVAGATGSSWRVLHSVPAAWACWRMDFCHLDAISGSQKKDPKLVLKCLVWGLKMFKVWILAPCPLKS